MPPVPPDQRRLLSTLEAAEFLGVSVSMMNKLRLDEGGPPFIKISSRVTYSPADLEAWIAAQKRTSTGRPGRSVVLFPDDGIRSRVVAARSEAFVASYLDPATWDDVERSITPLTDCARRKLCEFDLRKVFADLGVTVAT